VQLGGEIRLWIVSGSNMSGKSTLLRTIGINTVLAWAGAPVRAARLKISPLSLGASIRVRTRCRTGVPASTPKSLVCARSSPSPAAIVRCCFCWTSC
jgi:hypothetical protein